MTPAASHNRSAWPRRYGSSSLRRQCRPVDCLAAMTLPRSESPFLTYLSQMGGQSGNPSTERSAQCGTGCFAPLLAIPKHYRRSQKADHPKILAIGSVAAKGTPEAITAVLPLEVHYRPESPCGSLPFRPLAPLAGESPPCRDQSRSVAAVSCVDPSSTPSTAPAKPGCWSPTASMAWPSSSFGKLCGHAPYQCGA